MFKKNNKQQPLQINDQQISTIIGEGYVFTGELQGSSIIRIEGKVIGNVCVDCGVILGENGIVEGNITSKSVIIYGTVHGNIKTTQLEIKRTGIINGEITTDTLEIELGAKYNGTLNMQQPQVLKEAS
ncbi:MAG TPA: polymer-forming cytoskeletal protein [Chitinophagaceae bacterium]|nr:polymer-forming cytoskeletal protein [Chitinophagaceae bacterium]